MSVTKIFCEAYNMKLSDCKDVMDYTGRYQVAFDEIQSLITEDSWMSKRTVEMTLQKSLLQYFGREYSTLISAIETVGQDETTNLGDTILRVARHAEITKGNEENNTDYTNAKVLAANIYRSPKGTCTTKECIKRSVTTHYTDWCWVIHSELQAKYSLQQIQIRRSNQNLKKANTPIVKNTERRVTAGTPEINS